MLFVVVFFGLTPFLHLLLFPNESPQEAIDIFEGVRDDQALRMAANLGFKGVLQRQVIPFMSPRKRK